MPHLSTPSPPRLLVIGLDGATFDLILPWVAAGELPHIGRLMRAGAHGPLKSTLQPVTAPAWTSGITGVNQGKHGLYDFIRRKPQDYGIEVTNSSHVHAPTVFDIAGHYDKFVVSINVPYTFPPRPVNGIMVGGPFAMAVTPELVSPRSFYQTLQAITPDYFVLPNYDARHPDPLGDYASKLLYGFDIRQQLCSHVMRQYDWDLLMVVFMAIDEAQHAYWHYMEATPTHLTSPYRNVIRDMYRRADEAIGALIAETTNKRHGRDTNIMILSDHGAGPLHAIINLNRWLADTGFLKFLSSQKNVQARMMRRLAETYRQFLPPQMRTMLRKFLRPSGFDRVKGTVETVLLASTIDWQQTKVYALGAGGNLFVNLQGREPMGIVKPGAEYEEVRNAAIDALMHLQDPHTGKKLVRCVHKREALYHGQYLDQAPDLIIEWVDYGYWGRGRYDSDAPLFKTSNTMEFTTLPLSGAHRPEGILIMYGPNIQPGPIHGARLLDIAPTILELLGLPSPPYMDGISLTTCIHPKLVERSGQLSDTIDTETKEFEYLDKDAETIAKRLRSLGYL